MTTDTTNDQSRYIPDSDRLLGRTYDVFGAPVRVDHYFPPTETHTEALAVRLLDNIDRTLIKLDARTWRDLESCGAIVDA